MITGDMEQYLGSSSLPVPRKSVGGDLQLRNYSLVCLNPYLDLISEELSYTRSLDMLSSCGSINYLLVNIALFPENLDRSSIQPDVQQSVF